MRTEPTIDDFMLHQWEFMLEVVHKHEQGSLCHYKLPLLFLTVGKLEGYGLAHPKPGKLTAAWRMARRIRRVAEKLEGL